jgi:hypothetical protein
MHADCALVNEPAACFPSLRINNFWPENSDSLHTSPSTSILKHLAAALNNHSAALPSALLPLCMHVPTPHHPRVPVHQGVRAAGEAEDAPLDESDSLQVAARLRLLWSDWRKLGAEQQRTWGDKQLGECAAVAAVALIAALGQQADRSLLYKAAAWPSSIIIGCCHRQPCSILPCQLCVRAAILCTSLQPCHLQLRIHTSVSLLALRLHPALVMHSLFSLLHASLPAHPACAPISPCSL